MKQYTTFTAKEMAIMFVTLSTGTIIFLIAGFNAIR